MIKSEKNFVHEAAHEYSRKHLGKDYAPIFNSPSSLVKQAPIARIFALAASDHPEYKKRVYEAYKKRMPKHVGKAKDYDELVNHAYQQLIKETKEQFHSLPINMSFHKNGEGNYSSSKQMLNDIYNNRHLYVYQGGEPHQHLHEVDPETGLSANDMFRAVHDFYGHGVHGSQFGPKGEEQAWAAHSGMFSPLARMAMTSETRGQNSYVNYSPLNAELKAEVAKQEEAAYEARRRGMLEDEARHLAHKRELMSHFQFAPQKSLLLPPEMLHGSYEGGVSMPTTALQSNPNWIPKKADGGSMAPLTQLSATDPMLQGDVQPTSNAISLTPAEEKLAQQAALAATQADLLQGGNSNATTSTATNGSPTGSVVGDIGYSLSAMAPFSVMGLVAQSMMDSMSPISPTSVNAVNGLDAQSDEATANGQAPTGSVNSGVSTAPGNDGVGVSDGSAGDATSGDSAAHGGSIHATKDMDTMRLALFKKGSRVSADTHHIKHTTKPSIFIGPEAATWDANHAFMAAKLEKQKHTPEEIWRKTGTFRSPSGGWKQEISDKASKFRTHADIAEMAMANAEKQGELKMGIERSLQHEKEAKDLFPKHAVAARKEVKAKLAKLKEEAGGYHGINASPNLTGNRLDIALEHPELYKAYPQLRETILKQGNNGLAGPLGSQQGKLINVNGRAFLEEPRSTALHEVQHAVQDIENWPRGGNVDMFTEQRLRERKKYMNIVGTINGLLTHATGTPEYEELLKKRQDLVNIMQKQGLMDERDILKNAFRDYQHLGGEAEARAVQARRNMSDAERRENFPLNSYDVNPKQVINTNQYGEPMQMQMPLARGGIVGKLRKHGQGVPNELEAMKRMSQGHRVFVVHEQDEHPREVTSVRELAGYAPDQMYTLAPHHEAHGGRITHAHHLEMEERPL